MDPAATAASRAYANAEPQVSQESAGRELHSAVRRIVISSTTPSHRPLLSSGTAGVRAARTAESESRSSDTRSPSRLIRNELPPQQMLLCRLADSHSASVKISRRPSASRIAGKRVHFESLASISNNPKGSSTGTRHLLMGLGPRPRHRPQPQRHERLRPDRGARGQHRHLHRSGRRFHPQRLVHRLRLGQAQQLKAPTPPSSRSPTPPATPTPSSSTTPPPSTPGPSTATTTTAPATTSPPPTAPRRRPASGPTSSASTTARPTHSTCTSTAASAPPTPSPAPPGPPAATSRSAAASTRALTPNTPTRRSATPRSTTPPSTRQRSPPSTATHRSSRG